jgi:hypothetical protein
VKSKRKNQKQKIKSQNTPLSFSSSNYGAIERYSRASCMLLAAGQSSGTA